MDETLDVVAINANYPAETLAHLIKYDTNHGKFEGDVVPFDQALLVNGHHIQLLNNRDPRDLPWERLDVDIVIEATGKFNSREKAAFHLDAGAKKVILTAPGEIADVTIVMGVNEDDLQMDQHLIISNGSLYHKLPCTCSKGTR